MYFSALDAQKYGRTGLVELDLDDSLRVIAESEGPVLDIGLPGIFDDCGANAFSVLSAGTTTFLYYQGWQRAERVPHLIFTGLAIDAGEGMGFQKYSRTPILDRREDDPYLRGAPFVVRQGDLFRMWYVSCSRWVEDVHGLNYRVGIRHAVSDDGVTWSADPGPCVTPVAPHEYAVGRPSVLVVKGTYHMWYSIRSFDRPYRIGHAVSPDGLSWTRVDAEMGIDRSAHGWDSKMVCYPNVVRIDDRLLMLYNGNQHGATGFGYAEASVADLPDDAR
ncbi:MAG: hypothetical protein WKF96_14590 [Solirubrobacteraceae bacterium]